ncbi:hypothetical protein PFAG_05469 [Plasmodium falciparum Santa Lucia]|uniref:Uncharacterized protein n=6 Tax=Plasmodium falciparum TaxID=5833 RepID=W4IVJ5_PLAFP|nr:hypothetical protein PFFVO_05010 [Plasmodium falciparum Vietnam Oak-Knoll (FVO)]ETW39888.1 hypothetical protein PFNF135_05915 [Plasmodium falciparum NF135/5.C10]ETW46687.1 hypothetical protein PFMALIP_05212 [Plasmodium falciparum MaliPS096_E11]ETW54033.1 hypothetical protein PFUGPA_03905 [Plasmodium falciparum Palo Alto/Uganda]ETW58341.1 hypothetical protein PFMC_05444 [Plasmodium falciparum CAMP/Malaysia]EUT78892.1 hypothetical protein PFAG_05469 [Plasmodium falciparum Santa Lucia]
MNKIKLKYERIKILSLEAYYNDFLYQTLNYLLAVFNINIPRKKKGNYKRQKIMYILLIFYNKNFFHIIIN